jgi:hypothetical protein
MKHNRFFNKKIPPATLREYLATLYFMTIVANYSFRVEIILIEIRNIFKPPLVNTELYWKNHLWHKTNAAEAELFC